ncbi:hypothetical protein [Mixta calida]|uniref:hypothetical protein n=1 Tax=Mixta calida TaxID=665913 RepID=UPI0034D5066D
MYENEKERLADITMGEAVIELLDERTSITNAILLLKLQSFLATAEEMWKEAAIRGAIRKLQAAVLVYEQDDGSRTGGRAFPLH